MRNRIKELKYELSSKNKELQRIVDFEETYSSQNTTESEARTLSKNYSLNRLAASIAYQNRQYISELKIDNELLRRELDRMRNYLNVNKYDNHMDLDIDEPSIKMLELIFNTYRPIEYQIPTTRMSRDKPLQTKRHKVSLSQCSIIY